MAILGVTTNRYKFYIADEDPPTAGTTFTDYSVYFFDFKVPQRLNKLYVFEGKTRGLSTSQLADFQEGNILYVLSNQTLVGKFVLEKPEVNSNGFATIRGIQSTGTSALVTAGGTRRRKLANERISINRYDGAYSSNVLWNDGTLGTGPYGLLNDSTDGTELLALDGTDNGSSNTLSLALNSNDRFSTISDIGIINRDEWWIDHGVNDATPFTEGDTFHMNSRKGTGTSQFTFDLTSDTAVLDVVNVECQRDFVPVTNFVTVQGYDTKGEVITTNVFEATPLGEETSTTFSDPLDAWLPDTIDAVDTSFSVTRNPYWETLGNFIIRIDRELIKVTSAASSGDGFYTVLTIASRGYGVSGYTSTATEHKASSDVVLLSTADSLAAAQTVRLYVTLATNFSATGGSVRVGSDVFLYDTLNTIGSDYFNIKRIASTGVFGSYAHGSGVNVYQYGDTAAGDTWTPQNPETGSSIALYGIKEKTYLDNISITKHQLDTRARTILEASREPVYKITLAPIESFTVFDAVELGDGVTFQDATSIDYPHGGPYVSVEARVIGIDVEMRNAYPQITLYLSSTSHRVLDYTSTPNVIETIGQPIKNNTYENVSNSAGQSQAPISNFEVTGNIIPDPDYDFSASLSVAPSLGLPEYPWEFLFVDNSIISTDSDLQIKTSGATKGFVKFDNADAGTNSIVIDPSTEPGSPDPGEVYSDDTTGHIYHYNSVTASWDDLTSGVSDPITLPSAGGNWTISAGGTAILTIDISDTTGVLNIGSANQVNLSIKGDILPDADNLYNLGSDSLRWDTGYFSTEVIIGDSTATGEVELLESGGDLQISLSNGDQVYPLTDNAYSLGRSGNRWKDVWATDTSINAYCENNLLTEEEQKTGKLSYFEEGMVMSWKNGKLVPCNSEYDPMVQAVATKKGMANVMGAEPIMVIGPISEGDYLVSSSIPGYAMKGELQCLVPGCVIGQALEGFSGERGRIKAMIRKF